MKDKTPDKRKHVLVIDGHPDNKSLCTSLAGSYVKGAGNSGYRCAFVHLSDLDFDPVLHKGYRVIQELEPDLLMLQEEIMKADHVVMVYPVWWATFPALLKGMIDRVFLPGVMFSFHKNGFLWEKYMKGKSARLIVTMDSPPFYYRFFVRKPGDNALKKGVLKFSGFRPVRVTHLGSVKGSDLTRRRKWLKKCERMGMKMK